MLLHMRAAGKFSEPAKIKQQRTSETGLQGLVCLLLFTASSQQATYTPWSKTVVCALPLMMSIVHAGNMGWAQKTLGTDEKAGDTVSEHQYDSEI